MDIKVIEAGSAAFVELHAALMNPKTYEISLSFEEDRGDGVCIKTNSGMWTAPLSTERPR